MTKIDFSKIKVTDIEGNEVPMDVRFLFGNMLYMQGVNVEECELGREIFKQSPDKPLELSASQSDIVRQYAGRLPYVTRQAILKAFSQ